MTSRTAPRMPPIRLGTMRAYVDFGSPANRGDSPTRPRANPAMANRARGVAIVGRQPDPYERGKDTSVPPPATELMEPAMNAAMNTTRYDTDTIIGATGAIGAMGAMGCGVQWVRSAMGAGCDGWLGAMGAISEAATRRADIE